MDQTNIASQFCDAVPEHPDITNATARLGAWLIGAANRTGGFPIELSLRQMRDGFTRNGVSIEGTGSRLETIKASLQWMEEQGMLRSTEGTASGFGHHLKVYTMVP